MPVKVKLDFRAFSNYLEDIQKAGKLVNEAVEAALDAGADVLVNGMKLRAPVDTGNLQEHIDRTPVIWDGNDAYVYVGLLRNVDAETARYGTTQEYGSAKMPAHPYIRPTVDEDRRKVRKVMVTELKKRGLDIGE
jgi:HK97 gp10 family phage protein